MICTIDGCEKKRYARGMCITHYQHWWRYGTPHVLAAPTAETYIERFWNYVDKSAGEDACWPWTAARDKSGYGRYGIRRENKVVFAHRFALELSIGEIPDGLIACHRCNNPPCCNVKHLYAGTVKQNHDDYVATGKYIGPPHYSGVQNGHSKLNEEQVRSIRARFASGETRKALAEEFGVSGTMIGAIVHRDNWKHVL